MAIYDLKDPTDPNLLDLCTRAEDDERFKDVHAVDGHVGCTIMLNPRYEATFSMTPDHARDIAVRLIDAAEQAEFQQAQDAAKRERQQQELVERKQRRKR
jgi:hypothetical protein